MAEISHSNIYDRLQEAMGTSVKKRIAKKLGLTPSDLGNRLKRRTLLTPIVHWAVEYDIDLNWLITGIEPNEGAENTPGPVNTELLQGVIKGVEDYLKKGKLQLDPEHKARLVAILYDRFDVADEDVNPRIVSDYLKLVA